MAVAVGLGPPPGMAHGMGLPGAPGIVAPLSLPAWALEGNFAHHPAWPAFARGLRSKVAADVQGRQLSERLAALAQQIGVAGDGEQKASEGSSTAAGSSSPWRQKKQPSTGGIANGGNGRQSDSMERRNRELEQLRLAVKSHLLTLDGVGGEVSAGSRTMQQAIKTSTQALRHQIEEQERAMLAAVGGIAHGKLVFLEQQKNYFNTKLAQLKIGSVNTPTAAEAALVAEWSDPNGAAALTWEAQAPVATRADAGAWLMNAMQCGGWPEIEARVAKLLADSAGVRAALSTCYQREAALAERLSAAQAAAKEVAQQTARQDEGKKRTERRLAAAERERQEKNEEVSRLHLQLRGAVDGLKKKTEEVRRLTAAVKKAEETVETLTAELALSKSTESSLLAKLEQSASEHADVIRRLAQANHGTAASAPTAAENEHSSPPSTYNAVTSEQVTPCAPVDTEPPTIRTSEPPVDSSLVDGASSHDLPVSEAAASALEGSLRATQKPGNGPVDSQALEKAELWTELDCEEDDLKKPMSVHSDGDEQPGVGPLSGDVVRMPSTLKVVASAAQDFDAGGVRLTWAALPVAPVASSAGVQNAAKPTSRAQATGPVASTSGSTPDRLCAMPTFSNTSLLPFKIVEKDSDAQTVDFDVEGIADKGSRSSALLSSTQLLLDVLKNESSSPEQIEDDTVLFDLQQLVNMRHRLTSAAQATESAYFERHCSKVEEFAHRIEARLERMEMLQRLRYRHLGETLHTLQAVLGAVGGASHAAETANMAITASMERCIARYEAWQREFFDALGPAMDVTDGLLVRLYHSIEREKQLLALHHDKVAVGRVVASDLAAAAGAFVEQLRFERQRRAFEYTRTMREQVQEVLNAVKTAQSTRGIVSVLKERAQAVAAELLSAREQGIRMGAELQLMRLHGSDKKSLTKADSRVQKHAEKTAALEAEQLGVVAELRLHGIAAEEIAILQSGAAGVGRDKVLRQDLQLKQFADVTALPSVRGNLFVGRLHEHLYLLQHVQLPQPTVTAKEVSMRQQLEDAVSRLTKLDHPCLPKIEALFYDGEHAYLQHPCDVPAVTLRSWLTATTRKAYEVCEVFRQLLQGIAYLHHRHVFMRALSLDGVVITSDRSPLLLDVGLLALEDTAGSNEEVVPAPQGMSFINLTMSAISNAAKEPSARSTATGSASFVAPEVEAGGATTAASDLWALGAMLFQTVFGQEPVPDPRTASVPIPEHDDECLRQLLSSILQIDPKNRLSSADEALAHPYFATDVLGRDSTLSSLIADSAWKSSLVRHYGRRLQTRRIAISVEVSDERLVDDVLSVWACLADLDLTHPLNVSVVAGPSTTVMDVNELYTAFFSRLLQPDASLFEAGPSYDSERPMALLPKAGADLRTLEQVGRVVVKCVVDGCVVPSRFAPSFYKYLASEAPNLRDLASFDPHRAAALGTVLQASDAARGAAMEAAEFSTNEVQDVLLGKVSFEQAVQNKVVQLLVDNRLPQLQAIKAGFKAVDLACCLPVFSWRDLHALLTVPSS
eukprot:jgi/Chlat1/4621/Chrsp3S05581